MKNSFYFILVVGLFIFSSCADNQRQQELEKERLELLNQHPYPFETIILGGCELKYDVKYDEEAEDWNQTLSLKSNDNNVKVLNETSYGVEHNALGRLHDVFRDAFILRQINGKGNPIPFQLIGKETGNSIKEGFYVNSNEKEEVVLYLKHETSDSLLLYDHRYQQESYIPEFNNSACVTNTVNGFQNCVRIGYIDRETIMLNVDAQTLIILRNR